MGHICPIKNVFYDTLQSSQGATEHYNFCIYMECSLASLIVHSNVYSGDYVRRVR